MMEDNDTCPDGSWAGPIGPDAAAQLAEKERESRNLKCAVKLLTERAEAAEQRLQEAQATNEKIIKTINLLPSVTGLSPIQRIEDASLAIRDLQDNYADAARARNGQYTKLVERLRQREAELEQRWIAVEARLPEIVRHFGGKDNNMYGESEKILIFNGELNIGWLYKSGTWESADGDGILEKVTHWQPLPAPPKEAQ